MYVEKLKKLNYRKIALITIAFGLVAFGAWGYSQRYQTTHKPNPEIPAGPVTYSTDQPDETPVVCDGFDVPDNEPRQISLPSLNSSGCIQKVGVDQDNLIAVPTNIHVAGWYINSVLPGENGVSIIDGHVQGRYQEGIFKHIGELNPGDKIRVQYGDHSWREFEVLRTDSYSVEETAKQQYKQASGITEQLTLITCGGNYSSDNRSYDQRVLVSTKLIK